MPVIVCQPCRSLVSLIAVTDMASRCRGTATFRIWCLASNNVHMVIERQAMVQFCRCSTALSRRKKAVSHHDKSTSRKWSIAENQTHRSLSTLIGMKHSWHCSCSLSENLPVPRGRENDAREALLHVGSLRDSQHRSKVQG